MTTGTDDAFGVKPKNRPNHFYCLHAVHIPGRRMIYQHTHTESFEFFFFFVWLVCGLINRETDREVFGFGFGFGFGFYR